MWSPRSFVPFDPLGVTATLVSIAIVLRAAAVDHVVHVQCIPSQPYSSYGMDPDTVVVAAGVDRIVFQSPSGEDDVVCVNDWMAPTFEFDLWRYPLEPVSLWFSGETSPPQGPFCEPGTRAYNMTLRGSHGDIRGSFGPFVIEVTSPQVSRESSTGDGAIGVFADLQAASCVLPTSPGPQRAYVCARFGAGSPGVPWRAEFRVMGFPSEWPVTAVRLPAVRIDFGSVLGDGVRASIGDCVANPPLVIALYAIDYEVTTPVVNAIVRIEAARLSKSTHPTLAFCLGRGISEICAVGGNAYLGGDAAPCIVGVQDESWKDVKFLYRDASSRQSR